VTDPQVRDPRDLPTGPLLYTEPIDRIDTKAKVIFVASCKLGAAFKSLWDIQEGTIGRALVVPTSESEETDFGFAIDAWNEMLSNLLDTTDNTLQIAVDTANFLLQRSQVATSLRFQIIGDPNVKIQFR
jgi:hypothetical protein